MMNKFALQAKGRYGIYRFSPSRAELHFQKVTTKEMSAIKCQGWGAKLYTITGRYHSIALYLESGKVYLQIDLSRWDISIPEMSFSLKRRFIGIINTFSIFNGDRQEFSCHYFSYSARPFNIIDPGYGALEEEFDDLFLLISNNANDKSWVAMISEKIANW